MPKIIPEPFFNWSGYIMNEKTSVFNKIVEISEKMIPSGFLSLYKDDLYFHDKKSLEDETKHGSNLVWVLKHGGAGTAMLFTGSDYAKHSIKLQSKKSLFFLIECTGVNEGSIKQLGGLDDAIRAIDEKPFVIRDLKNSRNDVIKSVFRLGADQDIPYELRKLNAVDSSVSYVCCKLYGKTLTVNILSKSPNQDAGKKADITSMEMDFNCHLDMLIDLSKRDGQKMMFEIKNIGDGACTQREMDEKDYKKCVSSIKKQKARFDNDISP